MGSIPDGHPVNSADWLKLDRGATVVLPSGYRVGRAFVEITSQSVRQPMKMPGAVSRMISREDARIRADLDAMGIKEDRREGDRGHS